MAMDTRPHALWAALTLAACAGDPPADEGQTTTSPGGSDTTDTTADTTGAQEPMLVIVVDAKPPYPEPNTPAVGAVVALDTAEGRLEATTDAEGRAYFEGFEWNGESVDITIAALDYVMMSRLGLREADTNEAGEIELEIHALGMSDSVVEIWGPALNMQDGWNVIIASIGGPEGFAGIVQGWSASFAPNQPFSLVALETNYLDGGANTVLSPILGWFTLEHPGVSEDTELPIDFAMPTAPEYAAGSFGLPARPDSPLRVDNVGYVNVVAELTTDPNSQLIGRTTSSTLRDDGNTFDYELEYVTPAIMSDPHTCFRVWSAIGPNHSTTCVPGLPGDGAQDVDILDATEVAFVPNRSLYDPVEFELHDAAVVPELHIDYGASLLWIVVGPEDATSLTVPQPPPGFVPDATTLDVSLWLTRPAPDGKGYQAWAIMEPFSAGT
jgi:hypothetical protein